MPYTRTDTQGHRLGGLNEGRMPANYRVDFRFDKDFYFSKVGTSMIRFFVEVNNVLDRRNVVNVYTRTGLADDDGQITSGSDSNGPSSDEVNRLKQLLAKDPQNLDEPRSIQWGLEWIF
jgi:hypothetical protein